MAKLYFRYGTMDSAKTLNLLAVAHNYRKQGKSCVLMKCKILVFSKKHDFVKSSTLNKSCAIENA